MDGTVVWSYVVLALAVGPWVLYSLQFLFFLLSITYGRLKLHHKSDARVTMGYLPGISILKPLMGVDPYLETNLESHFTLNYPKFELLMCVEDERDPAVGVVKRLQARFPTVNSRLFVGGKTGVINPVVSNMAPAYDAAAYDIVWISNSRIKASTDILFDMVAKLNRPDVAVVHQMPFTTDQEGIAHAIEKVYFGGIFARYNLATQVLGISCVTGMSYLVKKHELDRVNGLIWFGRCLAEDYFIAQALHNKGFRHVVAAVPAQQNVACATVASYKDRMVRWLRLRLNMIPMKSWLLEQLGESIPLGIYASWSVYHLFGINPYVWFAIHWTVWLSLDYIQLRGVQNGPLPFSFLTFVLAWLTREVLCVYVFFEAAVGFRQITWGKRTYRLSDFGRSVNVVHERSSC